jgi:NAD kinase
VEKLSLPLLWAEIADAWTLYHAAEFGRVMEVLPGIIADARLVAAVGREDQRAAGQGALAKALQLGGHLATRLGKTDLALVSLERAMAAAEPYRRWEDKENPSSVIVFGGDGTMLRAITEHWRKRIPFVGVNQGHLGFLLNDAATVAADVLPETECVIRLMPMLYIETEALDGTKQTELAFNDAWVERATSQSAWLEVEVNGDVRIPKLVCDGALVCTAAGSTAYARSMGISPLLVDTPGWVLVGSNVMSPPGFKSALLSWETTVTLRSIGGAKRPLNGYVGGRPLGQVVSFHARPSRTATVELVFAAQRDMAEKISMIQFASSPVL